MSKGNTGSASNSAEPSRNLLHQQRGNYVGLPLEFLIQSKTLSLHARWLYAVLWRFVHVTDSGEIPGVFPSYNKLMEITGFGRASVAMAIKELTAAGWIKKQRRFGKSTVYFLQKSTVVPNGNYQ